MTDSTVSFWEPHGHRDVIKRVDHSYKLCQDLALCIQERAHVEKQYVTSLQKWSKKWEMVINNSSEYGTGTTTWLGMVEEANQTAEYHAQRENQLIEQVEASVRVWCNANITKGITGIKESKFYDGEFLKIQKPWLKFYKAVEDAKKEYFSTCRQLDQCQTQLANTETINQEQAKKLTEKVQKLEVDKRKTANHYEHTVNELNRQKDGFVKGMKAVFEKCQEFEKKRLEHFHKVYLEINDCLDSTKTDSLKRVADNYRETIKKQNIQSDLDRWSKSFGPGMPMKFPEFQEYDAENDRKAVAMADNRKSTVKNNSCATMEESLIQEN